ncbi:hypothetical protein [uncultured Duncaniella sp.]|uniref:hypothetical protein n=1 Tax=uncultured Duncaniella sp. TaxID=2768039 RepID=UPI0025B06DDA|nr:hypothetical protein [uncultured Duncaniella sp.]
MTQHHHITNEKAIFTLWLNWAIAVGALALPEMAALFVPRHWIPTITFGLMLLLIIYRNNGRKLSASSCDLIQTICVRTLCTSALIMIIISIIYTRHIISLFYPEELLNMHIPYQTILILGPVATFYCLLSEIQGNNASVCRECIIRNGTASERGFLGKVFSQESRYQVRTLLVLSATVSVTSWVYYALYYVNVNLNSADHFFYNWVPSILYGFSIIFFGMRYFGLWSYYYNHIEQNPRVCMNGSGVRFLIFHEDNIFLSRTEGFHDYPDGDKFDTPTEISLSHSNSISIEDAANHFSNLTGLPADDMSIRFMYKSTDMSGQANVFHFICCLPAKETINSTPIRGQWFTLSQLQRLLYNHDLTKMLASEIHRLYTVTMAWKTYDADGKRLYRIKNYRPTFRLKGICDWDVDFNDSQWLEVARFNEDKPLFHLRKLFHRRQRKATQA